MGFSNWLIGKIGAYLTKDYQTHRSHLCDFDRICHEIRPADVLLIEGRNRLSRIIQKITLSPWSHAALYIGRLHDIEDPHLREIIQKNYHGQPGDQLIVESIVGRGTFIDSIKRYREEHIRICRPSGLSHRDAQIVIKHAVKSLGSEYNIRQFFDLGRFLLKSKLIPPRFRSSLFRFNSSNKPTKDICSAMIAESFMSVNFPILPLVRREKNGKMSFIHRNVMLYAPSDFDYSPYFNIIKYPIYPEKHHAPYRDLPWKENIVHNDSEGIVTDEALIQQQIEEEKAKIKAKETEKKVTTDHSDEKKS